ncbi:MAG: type IV toxin-antitoxin system AbiEi family antitoxin domain-containing protein [Solirubrobacterales bacterium]
MPDERRFTHLLCGQLHARREESDDEAIAALASDQHGVVARHQLLEMGVSRRAIEHRVACGRLRPLHLGVYAVGHDALPRRGRVAAAVLAVRPRRAPVARATADPVIPAAAASHLTAAGLWGLTGDGRGLIHVTSQDGRRRLRAVAHHRAILPLDELAVLDGIPVTALARTLLDLSAVIDARSLRRIAKEAERRRLLRDGEVEKLLARYPRRPGRRGLADLGSERIVGSGITRSDLEDRFLPFCRNRRLPAPETNVLVEVRGELFEVDCVWRDERVAVELDGYGSHRTRLAFEDDRARDRLFAAEGWIVLRITDRQLERRPGAVAGELRATLARRASS